MAIGTLIAGTMLDECFTKTPAAWLKDSRGRAGWFRGKKMLPTAKELDENICGARRDRFAASLKNDQLSASHES